jgi:Putative zinc-finger
LLDGKLTATERARVTEHLAGCESCYEIFAGTAHILEDRREEQLHPAATPRPFERPRDARALRPRVWWAAAALAAVLAATIGLIVFLQGSRSAGPSTEQLASLVGPVPTGKVNWGRTMRGGGQGTEEQPELPPEHEAFQLGVRFLDLRLALASGNEPEAEEALRRLLLLFDHMLLPPPSELRAPYTEMQKELQQHVPPPAPLAAASAAEKKAMAELGEDPRMVELGRWTEACRLAGQKGRADLFRQPAALRVLDAAIRPAGKDEDSLDPQALGIVRTMREDIAGGHINPTDLAGHCESLLHQLANDDQ